jgi:hypothetical protein
MSPATFKQRRKKDTAVGQATDSKYEYTFGARSRVVVAALGYKPEGNGLKPDKMNYFFQFT